MRISSVFEGSRSILVWVAIGLMGASLFVELVVTAYWWSYYHPFGIHYNYLVKATYICTLMCWIFSLIALLLLILIVVSYFVIKPLADSDALSTLIVVIFSIFSIIACLFGIICGALGIIKPNYTYISGSTTYKYDCKCYTQLFSHADEAFDYAYDNNKAKDYGEFMYKLLMKIVKDKEVKDVTKEEFLEGMAPIFLETNKDLARKAFDEEMFELMSLNYNSNLCTSTGAPALVFAVILIVGLIVFACGGCCVKSGVGNSQSEDE